MAGFTKKFWHDLGNLGIYSTEADENSPTLADQMDAGIPGGANSTDTEDEAPEDDGLGDFGGSDDFGGGDDMNLDGSSSGEQPSGGDTGLGGQPTTQSDPNENPFKGQNGKALLDSKLAELQTAINDTLERIYANPRIEQVVVSELESLQDSVKNIRDTVFIVPVDATLYKYRLSTISYSNLVKLICSSLKEK